ncbi:MAG: transglycosylase domain-containing protein [Thermoleophilia bacterium]|nr:transglycosylase domain-containing protein [Thermoleophilia bacterium]
MTRSRHEDRIPVELLRARRRRQRKRESAAARRRKVLVLAAVVLAVLAGLAAAGGITAAVTLGDGGCELSSLQKAPRYENSFVYAADGTMLGTIPAERNRQEVPFNEISEWVKKATVAVEDRRFYDHDGVDPEGIARALLADIQARKAVQGGSTITQQLVRNLSDERDRTLTRKLREACLAVKLDEEWTRELGRERAKKKILHSYLNQVFYGNRAYGVEAAARTYFSKKARNLTLVESALLAGLPQAPTVYDPFRRPKRAKTRRDAVLLALLETRQITRAEYREAAATPVRLRRGRLYERIREPYFFGYVRELLVEEYGAKRVASGGLRVYTTIDPQLQLSARKAIWNTLYLRTDPDAALVSIDPRTGAIRAMVGVTRRKGNQFNLAVQARRQAGSTFKTFVLAAALASGIDPDSTTYISAPYTYTPPDGREPWPVTTYDGAAYGPSNLTTATLRSDNTVYAQLTIDLGAWKVAQMARRLGVDRSSLPNVPSLGLGAASVSPLELSSAYATLAAGGIYSVPMAIRKVEFPNGAVDRKAGWGKVRRQRVLADWVAAKVTDILEQNVLSGTGVAAQIGRPAAGKTGTTDDHADAWFCGYTPELQTTVWVGHIRARIPMLNVHGIRVAGGTFPAQIWGRFMQEALADGPVLDFPEPATPPVWRYFQPGPHALTSTSTYSTTPSTTTPTSTTPSYTPPTSTDDDGSP